MTTKDDILLIHKRKWATKPTICYLGLRSMRDRERRSQMIA